MINTDSIMIDLAEINGWIKPDKADTVLSPQQQDMNAPQANPDSPDLPTQNAMEFICSKANALGDLLESLDQTYNDQYLENAAASAANCIDQMKRHVGAIHQSIADWSNGYSGYNGPSTMMNPSGSY